MSEIKVYKIAPRDHEGSWLVCGSPKEIATFLDNEEELDEYVIKTEMMDETKFKNLQEHGGW